MATNPADQVLTTAEVADILGVTPQRVIQLDAEGKLRAARITRRGLRLYDRQEVAEVVAKRLAGHAMAEVAVA